MFSKYLLVFIEQYRHYVDKWFCECFSLIG